jgi:hypothetical protein
VADENRVRLAHVIEIPAGPGGRPGERLLAPNPSLHAPWPLGPDGSRSDFRFLIGRRGSHFGAVCLGPAAARPHWEAAGVEADPLGGERAWRTRLEFPRSVLIDWRFARGGWLFAAGVLCRAGDREPKMVERAEAVLATWEWIDAL